MNKIFLIILFFVNRGMAADDYRWTSVKTRATFGGVHVTGRVVPKEGGRIVESARVQGRITEIIKREGEKVVVGTPLFAVSSADCVSLSEEMRAAKNQNLKDMLQSTIRRENQLGLKVENENCKIVATHSGVIVKRNLELGQSFNIGDALATIIDISKLAIELDVPENELSAIKNGQMVSFQLSKKGAKKYSAPIEQIVPAIDQASRTVKIRLSPKQMPEGANIEALVFGDVQTQMGSQTLNVPTESLIFNHNKEYVIKKTGELTTKIAVQVISESEDQSAISPEIDGTLLAGDLVATKGALFLFNQINAEK